MLIFEWLRGHATFFAIVICALFGLGYAMFVEWDQPRKTGTRLMAVTAILISVGGPPIITWFDNRNAETREAHLRGVAVEAARRSQRSFQIPLKHEGDVTTGELSHAAFLESSSRRSKFRISR